VTPSPAVVSAIIGKAEDHDKKKERGDAAGLWIAIRCCRRRGARRCLLGGRGAVPPSRERLGVRVAPLPCEPAPAPPRTLEVLDICMLGGKYCIM
jgi:hypothetical protein